MLILFLIMFTILLASKSGTPTAIIKEYGPFELQVQNSNSCKGPKSKNCLLMKVETWANGKGVTMDTDVFDNVSPIAGKITALSKGKQLMRLQMTNPCQHLFVRPMLDTFFNTSNSCIVNKGHYKSAVPIEKIARDYFGGSFFYGNITFKAVFYSKTCNMFCTELDVSMSPLYSNK